MKEKPSYTIIGDNTVIEGNIKVRGSLMVAGKVTGDVEADETVRIALGAEILGRVKGSEIILNGSVGNGIEAGGKVILGEKSSLKGDLIARRLVVEEGAVFIGSGSISEAENSAAGGQ